VSESGIRQLVGSGLAILQSNTRSGVRRGGTRARVPCIGYNSRTRAAVRPWYDQLVR
jgi:hypothetical protein